MKVVKSKDFDSICEFLRFNFSSPTHWPDWNIVVSEHFKTDFFYYCAIQNDKLAGICPVHRLKYKSILWHELSGQFYYIPYGGWIFSGDLDYSKVKLPIGKLTSFQGFNLPNLKEFGEFSKQSQQAENKKTLIIDLEQNEDDLWMKEVDSKRRNMIRKAEKNGIEVSQTSIFTTEFYSVYYESCKKNELTLLSESFFRDLTSIATNISFDFFTARLDNDSIANIVIVSDKNYSIYWLGNNAGKARNDGQGELLQWKAIQVMKAKGCRYYDLCYIEKDRLPDIYKFKSGFARNVVEVPLDTIKPLSFRAINYLIKFWS